MSKTKIFKVIPLSDTKKGTISVAHIFQPYGSGSDTVVSIGISLKGESEPDWKVHIPYKNLDELINILHDIKDMNISQ